MTTDDTLPCAKCSEPIKRGASRCPNCGYEGYDDTPAKFYVGLMGTGSVLTFLIIGAPFGIPMILAGLLGWLYCKLFRRGYWVPHDTSAA